MRKKQDPSTPAAANSRASSNESLVRLEKERSRPNASRTARRNAPHVPRSLDEVAALNEEEGRREILLDELTQALAVLENVR
jgi:hypothetical protein